MSIDLLSFVTITAPAASDGRGEIAVVNDSTSANFVGYLADASMSVPVRQSLDNVVEGHGAVLGGFYYGPRSFTLELALARASTLALSNARRDKVLAASNAMVADGSVVYTESGVAARLLNFRREQYPTGPDKDGHMLLAGICKDPRIYKNASTTGASPQTNAGKADTHPTFTFSPTSNGTVIITNTTSGLGSPAVTLVVGTGFLTSGGGAVTVDFNARTVVQAGVSKYQAAVFPSSSWWPLVPGANTWTFGGTASITGASISFRDAWI